MRIRALPAFGGKKSQRLVAVRASSGKTLMQEPKKSGLKENNITMRAPRDGRPPKAVDLSKGNQSHFSSGQASAQFYASKLQIR